jgi:protein-disulfide isomerase
MDLEQFKKQHQVNACLPDREGEDVTKYIHQHIQWAKAVEITATPTVFVNGRKLPDLYNWADLVPVLDYALK